MDRIRTPLFPLRTLAIALLLSSLGCFGNEFTSFPPGLEPLEEMNSASFPAGHPEKLNASVGTKTIGEDDVDWIHARGYVHAPVSRIWQALHVHEVVVDRRQVDRFSVEATMPTDNGVHNSFVVKNEVDDLITVEFHITWRQGVVKGTLEEPEILAARFQKTYGTTFIDILRGSIVAHEIDDDLTEIEFIEHLSATAAGIDEIKSYIEDLYRNIVEFVHDRPLPQYPR